MIETVVALSVMAVLGVVVTQSMLMLNRRSSLARVKNLAKATVLSRIQEASAVPWDPDAETPVNPTILNVQSKSENIQMGDSTTHIGTLPATLQWTVANVSGVSNVRLVTCRVNYTYLGKSQNYEVRMHRSAD